MWLTETLKAGELGALIGDRPLTAAERQRRYRQRHGGPRAALESAIATWKLERGCADCGLKVDEPSVYDFDHVRGVKVNDIGNILRYGGYRKTGVATLEALVEEMEKCDVVCANCHRIRTAQRRRERG